MRVSDYIVKALEVAGINTSFAVTGGFAMHLNDSFGKSKVFSNYYHHHEQACGYAALGYSRMKNIPALYRQLQGLEQQTPFHRVLMHIRIVFRFYLSADKSSPSIRYERSMQRLLTSYATMHFQIATLLAWFQALLNIVMKSPVSTKSRKSFELQS